MKLDFPIIFYGANVRLASDGDVPEIRRLVNDAYKELADMGLNYTATYQDEVVTRERLAQGRAFVVERDGQIAATVILRSDNKFTGTKSAYVSQLAVLPRYKHSRLGSLFMDLCEQVAVADGFEAIQLDTAKPALHLVSWYLKRGYRPVGETRWEGKTYESWIFEKSLRQGENRIERNHERFS